MKPKFVISMILLSLIILCIHHSDGNTKDLKVTSHSYDYSDDDDDDDDDDNDAQKDTYTQLQQLLFVKGKDESPQNFIRLFVMRLIYGLAAQFGFEERLAGFLNGAFVPPNADDDYGGVGLFGGDYDDDIGGNLLDAIDL